MKSMIRIKVKHLLGGTGIFLLVLLISYIFLPPVMFAIGDKYNQKGNDMAAKLYYDRLDRYFPYHSDTAKALERAAEITSHSNLLMISSSSVGGVYGVKGNLSEEAQSYYKKLVTRFPDTWQGKGAKTELAIQDIQSHFGNNQIELAYQAMKNYYETVNANTKARYQDSTVALTAANILKSKGMYNEGLRFLDYFINSKESYRDQMVYETAAILHKLLGNKSEAEMYYRKEIELLDEVIQRDRDTSEITDSYQESKADLLNKIAALNASPTGVGRVTGSIALREAPLSSIQIFLQPQDEDGVIIGGTRDNALWSESDSTGRFAFDYVPPGSYSLGFIVNLDEVGDVVLKGGFFPLSTILIQENETMNWDFLLVDTLKAVAPMDNQEIKGDVIHFKWEEFKDAAYYTLEMGYYSPDGNGAYSAPFKEKKFYTNEAALSIEELASTPIGLSFDDDGPTPYSLLAYVHPDSKCFWGVRAHDKAGNILTSTRGYLKSQNTDFHFAERSLRKGDNFLLKRNYYAAIAAYEDDLSSNQQDVYALAMLAKLYSMSYEADNYAYADITKALDYYERLYNLTGKTSYLYCMVSILEHEQKDSEKADELLKLIEEIQKENP